LDVSSNVDNIQIDGAIATDNACQVT